MRTLFYTYTLNKNSGGALKSNMILAQEFEKRGHEIFFAIHKRSKDDVNTSAQIYEMDTKLGDLGRPFALKRVIEEVEPDVVIANMKPQNINLSIAKYLLGEIKTKFIGVERNPDLSFRYGEGKTFFRKIMKKLYENLDVIVANSVATKEDLKNAFFVDDEKIEVIYNTVDFEKVVTLGEEAVEPKLFEKKVVVNVGRLTDQKRQDLLIESFAHLDSDKYNLLIIGSGNREERLKQKAKDLGVTDAVHFLGHQDNPYKFVKNADVFVLTSSYEGFGRVVLESMALKTPVIAFSSVGGHNELLENGCGVLVPFGDSKKMAEEIEALLDDNRQKEEIIERAFQRVDDFHIDKHIDKFLKVASSTL